jgi:hypothetical protein
MEDTADCRGRFLGNDRNGDRQIEREDLLSPATTGLTIAEGKMILENLQKRMVAAQVEHHGVSMKACSKWELRSAPRGITILCCGPFMVMCPCAFGGSAGLHFRFGEPVDGFHKSRSGHTGAQIPYRQTGCADAIRQGGGFPL